MDLERLRELRRVVSNIPAGHFNMKNWCSCAIGHATRDKYFRDIGLKTDGLYIPAYGGATAFKAAEELFGISDVLAFELFSYGVWEAQFLTKLDETIRKAEVERLVSTEAPAEAEIVSV